MTCTVRSAPAVIPALILFFLVNSVAAADDGEQTPNHAPPSSDSYTCIVYIDRDIVPNSTLATFISQLMPSSGGFSSTPFSPNVQKNCRTFQPGDTGIPFFPLFSGAEQGGEAFAQRSDGFCPSRIYKPNICSYAKHTRFFSVLTHRRFERRMPSFSTLPQEPHFPSPFIPPEFDPIASQSNEPIPSELLNFTDLLPIGVHHAHDTEHNGGCESSRGGYDVEHTFVLTIGVNPDFLNTLGYVIMYAASVAPENFTFIHMPIYTTVKHFLEYEVTDYRTYPSTMNISHLRSHTEMALRHKADGAMRQGMPSEVKKQPSGMGSVMSDLFPIALVDRDPVQYGFVTGLMSRLMASDYNMTAVYWCNDTYTRTFALGFSHGVRNRCVTCNIELICVPYRYGGGYLTWLLEDVERQVGGHWRTLLLPPVGVPIFGIDQMQREVCPKTKLTEGRTCRYDSIFFNSFLFASTTTGVMKSPIIPLRDSFETLIDVADIKLRARDITRYRLFLNCSRYQNFINPPLVVDAADAVLGRYEVRQMLDGIVEVPVDRASGTTALQPNRVTVLKQPIGIYLSESYTHVVSITEWLTLLISYDFTSMATYNPFLHVIMEVVPLTNVNVGIPGYIGREKFSVTYVEEARTVIVAGGVVTTDKYQMIFMSDIWTMRIPDGVFESTSPLSQCKTNVHPCTGLWVSSGVLPLVLSTHTLTYYNGSLYLFGGTDSRNYVRGELYQAKLFEWNWTLIYTAPMPRSGHSAVIFPGTVATSGEAVLLVLGSNLADTGSSNLALYTLSSGEWVEHRHTVLPESASPCMFVVGESVYVMSGASGSSLYRIVPGTASIYTSKRRLNLTEAYIPCAVSKVQSIPSIRAGNNSDLTSEVILVPFTVTSFDDPSEGDGQRRVPSPESSFTEPEAFALITGFLSGGAAITMLVLPWSLNCSMELNEVGNDMNTGCVQCGDGFVSDGYECIPCGHPRGAANPAFRNHCVTQTNRTLIFMLSVPLGVIVMLFIGFLSWLMCFRVRDMPYHKSRNAPVSGFNFVAYYWVDGAPQLWSSQANDMAEVSSQLVALVRSVLTQHNCYEVVTSGDSGFFTARQADRLLSAGTEVWLQVAQREWSVGPLRVHMFFHYANFQCIKPNAPKRSRLHWGSDGGPTELIGKGIYDIYRCTRYVHGLVASAVFLDEIAGSNTLLTAKLAEVLAAREQRDNEGVTAPPSVAGELGEEAAGAVDGKSICGAVFLSEYVFDLCASKTAYRDLGGPMSARPIGTWWRALREGCCAGSQDHDPSTITTEESLQKNRTARLVAIHDGDVVKVHMFACFSSNAAPSHVRLPIPCHPLDARVEVTPQCKAAGRRRRTWAHSVTAQATYPKASRPVCTNCGRRTPRELRFCELAPLLPPGVSGETPTEAALNGAARQQCPLFRLTVSTHEVTTCSVKRAWRPTDSSLYVYPSDAPTMLTNRLHLLEDTNFSPRQRSRDTSITCMEDAYLHHPIVTSGLLNVQQFALVVQIVERLYEALLTPLQGSERIVVSEAIRRHLRLFTETFPDSKERSREVALRILQVVDMLQVRDLVEELGDSG